MVELSLILVFLGGLFLLTFDYARALNTYLVVVHATREAARVAAVKTVSTENVRDAARNAARDFVPSDQLIVQCRRITLNIADGTYGDVEGCPNTRAVDSAYRITVSAQFRPLFPFVGFVSGGRYAEGNIDVRYDLVGIVMDDA